MKTVSLFLSMAAMILVSSVSAWSHDGHDHDTPLTATAPKGGILKSLELTSVEVVSKGKSVFIYLYDVNLVPKPAKGFLVTAKAEMPRTKKTEEIKLTSKDNVFEGSFDAKGSHRYTLLLSIKDPVTGHDDKMTFTIEPRK